MQRKFKTEINIGGEHSADVLLGIDVAYDDRCPEDGPEIISLHWMWVAFGVGEPGTGSYRCETGDAVIADDGRERSVVALLNRRLDFDPEFRREIVEECQRHLESTIPASAADAMNTDTRI